METVFNLDNKYKLHRACGNSEREQLHYVAIIEKKAVASDGHVMVFVPINCNSTEVIYLHKDVVKFATSKKGFASITVSDKEVIVNKNGDIRPFPYKHVNNFPDMKSVYEKIKSVPHDFEIAIDVSVLEQVADAIGSSKVILKFNTNNAESGILVNPLDSENTAKGVVMPVRLP